MERPDVDLWDKNYGEKHVEWVKWHISQSPIDNLKEFMRAFMQFSKGRISPTIIERAWNESK